VIVLAFASACNTLDKMFWRDPRPYFLTKMSPLNCKDVEYGNPSGHAMVTTAIYLTVFYLLKRKGLMYLFLQAVFYCCVFVISINRFKMGVHSLDQLLNGCVLGAIICFVFTGERFQNYLEGRL
jgi:membrane-associated phospholipid phosphatase